MEEDFGRAFCGSEAFDGKVEGFLARLVFQVVASQDWLEITKYAGLVCAQAHRQELIQDLYKTWHDPQRGTVTEDRFVAFFLLISSVKFSYISKLFYNLYHFSTLFLKFFIPMNLFCL